MYSEMSDTDERRIVSTVLRRPTVTRFAIALVWLYQGLVCKLLAPAVQQVSIVAAVPIINRMSARGILAAVGMAECAIGIAVLAGRTGRRSAALQTMMLVAMNAAGLVWSVERIAQPVEMLVMNAAFLTLVWRAALDAEVPTPGAFS